jgi:hypothetical protein
MLSGKAFGLCGGAGMAAGGRRFMGEEVDRKRFVEMVRKACRIGKQLHEFGLIPRQASRIGPRIPSAIPAQLPTPSGKPAMSPRTMASVSPPRAKSAGAACTAGEPWSTFWSRSTGRKTLGFQADMAHTLLYTLGYNAPEARILPADFDSKQREVLDAALMKLTDALRPRRLISTSRRMMRR